MNRLLISKKNLPIGIEIADKSIKMVQLVQLGHDIKILGFGRKPLPAETVIDGEIKDHDLVKKTIKDVLSNPDYGSFRGNEANVSLPESKTFLKVIRVEKSSNPLSESIRAEIEKHFPINLEDVYYDWQEVSTQDTESNCLVAAVPKESADRYLNCLKEAGLDIIAFEPEAVAVCRAIIREEGFTKLSNDNPVYGIFDLGANRSSFSVYVDGTIKMNLSVDISNQELTEIVSENLDISPEQAEKAKLICGLDHEIAQGIVAQILEAPLAELSTKLKRAASYYQEHFSDNRNIGPIFLCGSGAHIKHICLELSKGSSLNCQLADPFVHLGGNDSDSARAFRQSKELKATFTGDTPIQADYDAGLDYVAPIGLALRSAFIDDLL